MGGIYAQYCPHNQPIYNTEFCSGCRAIKQAKAKKRYDDYWNKKRGHFFAYFKKMFEGDPAEPTYQYKIPDEFTGLKRSKSQEELKKEYHKLARKFHPDKKGGSTSMFQRLQNWYERLSFEFGF